MGGSPNISMNIAATIELIKKSPYFNSDWYLSKYPDVEMLGLDPVLHYLRYGALLGRQPSAEFDAEYYLETYKDVADAGLNPLVHFLRYGLLEGRFPSEKHATESVTPPKVVSGPKKQQQRANLPVRDIEAKLWGGFSDLALLDLQAVLDSDSYDKASKAHAAFVLGRWHALNEEWEAAIASLREIRRYDMRIYRSKKCKVLLVQCLIKAGDYKPASEVIDFALNKGPDGDFALAQCNMLHAQKGEAAAEDRLESINQIYRAFDLSEVSLEAPDRGFVFDNFKYDLPPQKTVEGPLVSILMPVYKAGEFIDVALKSLLSQTWHNLEIIAVDDCSPDDSWDRLSAWAARDNRLKIFKNPRNLGAYPTRNQALELSMGQYITVHDSDDWSHPQMIEMQMKELLADDRLKVTCSSMARVYPDMDFILRPQRGNLEYVHRSYPSVMLARSDLERLGRWDGVSANADDEFVQRARVAWGQDAVKDIMPAVPFSFFLVHENSLTQQKGTNLNSLTFGIRKEYARSAAHWRKKRAEQDLPELTLARTDNKTPFPIPMGLAPKDWEKNTQYDIVLITDMSLLGGTRRCNESYIQAAVDLGLRVGLFHWPRYDLRLAEVADEYLELAYNKNVDILVREDSVSCKHVLIHHPPILKYRIDAVPEIETQGVSILINQSPMQLYSQAPFYYDPAEVETLCKELFGKTPTWIPIAPRVTRILEEVGGYDPVLNEIWSPPFHGALPDEPPAVPADLGAQRPIVLGRHARNHWTKWPGTPEALRDAYCADRANISVKLLGGAETPKKMLETLPDNWEVLEFDSVQVKDFVDGLDFFLHYINEDYIEEFGRNIMEAMAASRVVILPHSFRDTFGDAAVYCEPKGVSEMVESLWSNPDLYKAQVQKGFDFVLKNCSQEVVKDRLQRMITSA